MYAYVEYKSNPISGKEYVSADGTILPISSLKPDTLVAIPHIAVNVFSTKKAGIYCGVEGIFLYVKRETAIDVKATPVLTPPAKIILTGPTRSPARARMQAAICPTTGKTCQATCDSTRCPDLHCNISGLAEDAEDMED